MKFFYFISLLLLFIVNSTDKTLSLGNLSEKNGKIRANFAEIFGQGWENNQNSNWQNDQNELNSEESISNDQNNDQFDDHQKSKIVHKFHAIKEGIKKKRNYSEKVRDKIEQKISKKLGISRWKIYKWKRELKLNKKNYYVMKRKEFIERIEEFKRMSENGEQHKFVKKLGICKDTLRKWKKEFGIVIGKSGIRYSNEEKATKLKIYYQMKTEKHSLSDKEIAEFLKISLDTLKKWKKQK